MEIFGFLLAVIFFLVVMAILGPILLPILGFIAGIYLICSVIGAIIHHPGF